ncbi:hypothetical protein [Stenotrophomonas pavanii]
MNTILTESGSATDRRAMHAWRPLFWEPVSGTGERILAGIIYSFDGAHGVSRLIRDEVLDGMFGKQAGGARKLIEHALKSFLAMANQREDGLGQLDRPFMGLFPGGIRLTSAATVPALLRTAALLYSSMANLAKLEELDQSDTPLPEEINRRFSTEVRDIVVGLRPEFADYFGRTAQLVQGGQRVRFGFCSPDAVMHFSVLHPTRVSASIRDARARLFELQRARELTGIANAALIGAVSRNDDATLDSRQRQAVDVARQEIEAEADAARLRFYPVTSAQEGAERVLQAA